MKRATQVLVTSKADYKLKNSSRMNYGLFLEQVTDWRSSGARCDERETLKVGGNMKK